MCGVLKQTYQTGWVLFFQHCNIKLQISFTFCVVKAKLQLRLAVAQQEAGTRGDQPVHVALAGLTNSYKVKRVWRARRRAAGPIITAELASRCSVDAAVGQEDDEAQCLYCTAH